MTGWEPDSFSRINLLHAVSNHDVSAAACAAVFSRGMHVPWCTPLASGSVKDETHLISLSCKSKSIKAVRRDNAVRVTFPYLFNSSWSSDWAILPVKCVECWWRSQFTNWFSAWRLALICLLWCCHRSALRQHRYPVTTRQAAGFFSDDFRGFTNLHRLSQECHFEMLHEDLFHAHVWIWVDAKNYIVVASSLNNQPNNNRQLSWAASVSSVAQKTCFKRILKLRHR